MKAKYNGTCKVTGLPIIANVTEIAKINGAWQVANAHPVQQAQAQARPTVKAVNLDEKLTSGKWSGYSLRDLARSFVGREYVHWGMTNHPSPITRKACEYALNNVEIDVDDYDFQFRMAQKGHPENEISWNPNATHAWVVAQTKAYSQAPESGKYGDDFLEDDELDKSVFRSFNIDRYRK